MYDERFIAPMRAELTQLGVQELKSAAEVDAALKNADGTTLVVVNSMCGCAARNARPAVRSALEHAARPDEERDGVRGPGSGANAAGAQLFHRLPSQQPEHRADEGRQGGVHARASPDRRALGRRNFARSRRRVRHVLRLKPFM